MGDRAVVVFKDDSEIAPAIYLHWRGDSVEETLRAAKDTLRKDDPSYSAARFAAACCNLDPKSNLSVGLLNVVSANFEDLDQGDNGVFVVDVATGDVSRFPEDDHRPGFSLGELPR